MSATYGPRRGNVNPRALVGKILLFNGAIFVVMSALLAVVTLLLKPSLPVTGLLAGIFAGVGLLEGVAGLLVWRFPGESATARVVNHYYAALERQDYAAAYQNLDLSLGSFFGEKITAADFAQRAQAFDAEYGPVTNFSLAGVRANPGSRIFLIRVTRRVGPYRTSLTLAQGAGGWKITGFDRF